MRLRILVLVVALLALASAASAQVSLSNFKCAVGGSDTTSVLHVLVGEPFLCQVTITNTGTATAQLNDIRLLAGDWAEQSSTTGVVSDVQLRQGQSTTAVFTGIKARKAGDQTFQSVIANGVAGDASGVVVKASTFQLTVTQDPPGTLDANKPFQVFAQVTAAGDLSSARVTLDTTCTLDPADQATTRTLGAIPDGASRSALWDLVQKTGGCAYSVSVRATGQKEISRSTTSQVSLPGGGGCTVNCGPPGGGGPSGGGAAPPEEKKVILNDPLMGLLTLLVEVSEEKSIPFVSKGAPQLLDFTKTVTSQVTFTLKDSASNVGVTSYQLASKPKEVPADPAGLVNKYLAIRTENIGKEANIQEATISFKVPKAALEGASADGVALQKYLVDNGKLVWKALPTTKVREDGDYIYFRSITPGFSIFAIAGERSPDARVSLFAITLPTVSLAPGAPSGPEIPLPGPGSAPPPREIITGGLSSTPLLGVGVAAIVGAAGVALVLLRRRKG